MDFDSEILIYVGSRNGIRRFTRKELRHLFVIYKGRLVYASRLVKAARKATSPKLVESKSMHVEVSLFLLLAVIAW
jgi:hypothetical protein